MQRSTDRHDSGLRRLLEDRRFDAVLGSFSDPLTIRDRNHRFLYANRAALDMLGFETWEELERTPPERIMADYLVWDAEGAEVRMEDIPSVRLLRGETAEPLLIRTVNRHTGAQRWQLLKAAPLLDDAGEVEATIMVIENVTEQQRAQRHAGFLARVSDILASSLDHEQTLRNVAWLTVPEIADWCAVDLVGPRGERQSVAVAHADPERLRVAEELRAHKPERPDPNHGLGLVLRTGEPVLHAEITDEMLVRAAAGERHLELLRAVGMRSAAIVPIRLGRRVLGALTIVTADSGRALEQADVDVAEEVATRAAVAIENSRLYSERSQVAHTLQRSLLPERLPDVPWYELAAAYVPALQSGEVGGDFYDVWDVAGGWIAVIGDVTGKGTEAAALTSLVRHTMRAASEFVPRPADLLAFVDRMLRKQPRPATCTALCLRLEAERVVLAAAGHPLPILLRPGKVQSVGEHGPLLGGFADASWHEVTLELEPRMTLVAYTDGVTDARGEGGERFGLERLCAIVEECGDSGSREVVAALTGALREFQLGSPVDDTAALVLRRRDRDRGTEPANAASGAHA